MKRLLLAIIGFLLTLGFQTSALADGPKRLALVIDQVDYSYLARLDGARAEGDAIANALTKTNFEITRLHNLDKGQLFDALNNFRRKIAQNPGSIAFIYYTGHGARDPNDDATENYLMGINADLQDRSDLPVFGVRLSEVVSSFEMANAKAVVIVLDACRVSASFGKATSKGLVPISAGRNVLVAYSTGLGNVADVGVFAPELANELQKPGEDLSDVFKNTRFAVNQKSQKKQLPWVDDKLEERICLVSCSSPTPNIDDAGTQKIVWDMINNCSGYDIYLNRWPNGIYASQARSKKASNECANKPGPDNTNKQKQSVDAQYNLGVAAYSKQDYRKASEYFLSACEGGNMSGCIYLGFLYENGKGVEQSNFHAKNFYEQACNGSDMLGCKNLGFLYENGKGVEQSYFKAKDLYEEACNGGESTGCTNLGWLFENGNGVNQSYYKAKDLYEKACNGGNMLGCMDLGVLYEKGRGGTQSYSKAKDLYEKACNGGESASCTNLGFLFENGRGVTQSYYKAKDLYVKGCNGGNMLGCTDLGFLYEKGNGVEQSYIKAKDWYEKGCNGGDLLGCNNLGTAYHNGNGATQSYTKAKELYEKSCNGGISMGCSNLGMLYEYGKGVTQSYSKAKELYEKACNGGNQVACDNYKRL